MAITTVMKNIFSFANILQHASMESIVTWDTVNVHNAFKWADYCQNIHQQTKDRSYKNELDKKIAAMGRYVEPRLPFELNLNMLSYASTLLKLTILGNKHTSNEVFHDVLLHSDKLEDDDIEFKKCLEVIEANDLYEYVKEYLEMHPEIEQISTDTTVQTAVKVLDFLQNLQSTCAGHCDYLETLGRVLHRISTSGDGWTILLNSLIVDEERENMFEIRENILQWILNETTLLRTPTCGLWRVGEDLLSRVASRYSRFCHHYTQHIVRWGDSLVVRYRQTGPLPRYDWIHSFSDDSELSYARLLEHIKQSCTYSWTRSVLEHVAATDTLPAPNIWRDISPLLPR